MNQVSLHLHAHTYLKLSDERVGEGMAASQQESEEKDDKEEIGMVTIVVAIDRELLRVIEASDNPELAADATTKVGEKGLTKTEPGELPSKEILETSITIDFSDDEALTCMPTSEEEHKD